MNRELNYSIYTPEDIAKSMVSRGLALYFSTGDIKEKMDKIRICDISCGNGNLLIPAIEQLIILSKKVYGEYTFKSQWVTGYDIDAFAIEEARCKTKRLLKKYGISCNVKFQEMDSLSLEGEKYNIIFGNPPYLGEKNNREIFRNIKSTEFGKKYYEPRMDYFYFFIEKAVELLKKDGIMVYLTTNYWLRADSGVKLRDTLKINGKYSVMKIFDSSLFSEATGQHNIIFIWKKSLEISDIIEVDISGDKFTTSNSEIYDNNGKIVLADRKSREFNRLFIEKSNYILDDLVNVNQGIISGHDKAFVFDKYENEFKEYLKPFYKSKDIGLYSNEKNQYWILYLDKDTPLNEKLENYLRPFYDKLAKRREVIFDRIKWWQLQWAREKEIFEGPKILVRQRCKTNRFSYDDGKFYGSADIYFITGKNPQVNLFYILGFMNSKIFLEWFKLNGKFKGKNYEFYATPLKETPIYYPENNDELGYIEKLVRKQIKNYDENIQQEIENYFIKVYCK